MKSLLLLALGLVRTVILGVRIEAERIVVSFRPYKKSQRRCPKARWVMDPFHVVQWMNYALDDVRREEWNTARAAAKAAKPRPKSKRGRPAKGELPPDKVKALEDEAASIKGSRYALVKNPEDLTDSQGPSSRRSRGGPARGW